MGGSPRGGAGITARQFNDYTARSISTEVARANYRKSIRSDYKVAELRQYVFKMVSSFSQEDKMAILAEYGDAKLAKTGKINEAVTETLIIRLKEEDLQLLLKDIRGDEVKLGRKVNKMRSNQKRMASKFGAGSFEDIYGLAREMKGPRNIQKALKAYDKSFKIPRAVRGLFRSLRRELRELIPVLFDKIEMTGLAAKMQIDFSEGVNQKQLIHLIIDKTILYVAIVTGRTKALYSGAIVDPEPFKMLLSYTTMPHLGGSPGMSKDGTRTLREEMLLAKARINETSRQKKRTAGIGRRGLLENVGRAASLPFALPGAIIEGLGAGGARNPLNWLPGLIGGAGGGIFGALASVLTLGKRGGMISGARAGAQGGTNAINTAGDFLKNPFNFKERRLEKEARTLAGDSVDNDLLRMTGQELFEEGAKYGLRPTKNLDQLRREITIQRRKKNVRLQRLTDKARKLEGQGRSLSEKERAEMKLLGVEVRGPLGAFEDPKNRGHFAHSGTTLPYISYNKERVADMESWMRVAIPVHVINFHEFGGANVNQTSNETPQSLTGSIFNPDGSMRLASSITGVSQVKEIDYKDSGLDIYRSSDAPAYKYNKDSKVFPGADRRDPFVALVDKPLQAMNIKGAMALRVFDQSNVILAQAMEKKMKSGSKSSKLQENLIESNIYSSGVTMVKTEPATPVYVVNKSLNTDVGKVLLGALDVLLKFIPGGQLISSQLKTLAGQTSGIDNMLSILGLSSGGKGKGLPRFAQGTSGSSVSSFIAGDSLNGKPNEEQVSIDWTKKEFKVKPIPSMTGQELNRSGVSQASRMSSAERNEPMKVYAVNPGITDMIDIGSVKVSMIGLVADMAGRLASIEGLLSIGNQQGVAIATATAATASNIGRLASKSSNNANPFAGGFPSDLDNILVGR
jgi:hypothetical protein